MSALATPGHRSARWLFFALLLALAAGCADRGGSVRLEGRTMGTSWHVTLADRSAAPEGLRDALVAELEAINDSMSTWREDSEISRFNRLPAGEAMTVSARFATVLERALAIGRASGGAYDVTVGPLVTLWGFGAEDRPDGAALPDPAAISAARNRVGQGRLAWSEGERLLRKNGELALDFSSIAKGYAVDRLAEILENQEISNYLVEIGGEMRVSGKSPRGDAWRVAVERPDPGTRAVARGIALTDAAVATSGDYRNFFTANGRRYSHMIDPRSGEPVVHDVVSVTVIDPSCTVADGWATALAVLGREAALRVAADRGLAVYLLTRDGEGFAEHSSPAFAPYLADPRG